MFLYHYLFALVLLALTAAVALGAFAEWDSDDEDQFTFSTRQSAAAYSAICAAVIISFIYFAPLSYGPPLSASSRRGG
jgi:dolichyl-phosphate-mannose--protein O-mannosyl transferase